MKNWTTTAAALAFFLGFFGAITAGVIVTGSAKPLWFLIVLALMDVSFEDKKTKENSDENT